jgi:vesicle coat complex subunit
MNQALAISLQDKNPQVRKNAIRDLTRIYDLMSQISQMLRHAMDDSDADVQETAKWALSQLNLQMTPTRLDLLPMQRNESKP